MSYFLTPQAMSGYGDLGLGATTSGAYKIGDVVEMTANPGAGKFRVEKFTEIETGLIATITGVEAKNMGVRKDVRSETLRKTTAPAAPKTTTNTAKTPPPPEPTTAGKVLAFAKSGVGQVVLAGSTAAGAYHGYKRNGTAGSAILWAILSGFAPFIAIPVALAQGFGKPKGTQ